MRRIYSIGWFIWVIDFATKVWAQNNLSLREPVPIIGSFLQLTYIKNSGAAFNFATGATYLLTAIGISALIVITYFATRITSRGWMVVSGLVVGGVLGNLTDRIFREPGFLAGHVIDWIEIKNWPVFNVADSAIVIAACISIILSIRNIAPIERKNVT